MENIKRRPLYLVPLEIAELDQRQDVAVSGVRAQVSSGIYSPPADQVAEHVIAWLFADDLAKTA